MASMFRRFVGVALLVVSFAVHTKAAAADNPQIQGQNLRVEFDQNLHSRVVARFDGKDTPLGPFTASETVAKPGKTQTDFLLTSQSLERVNDSFGAGERLTVSGKANALTKTISVTVYDDFPAMAFFDVQYTNTSTAKLAITSWTNNAYTVNAQPKTGLPAFLVLPERFLRKTSELDRAAASQLPAGKLSRHECQ